MTIFEFLRGHFTLASRLFSCSDFPHFSDHKKFIDLKSKTKYASQKKKKKVQQQKLPIVKLKKLSSINQFYPK